MLMWGSPAPAPPPPPRPPPPPPPPRLQDVRGNGRGCFPSAKDGGEMTGGGATRGGRWEDERASAQKAGAGRGPALSSPRGQLQHQHHPQE
eukprot:13372-Pyramimonas_sp.AAC.1